MIDKKKIAASAGSSIVQTVVAGITTFILFKLILATIGSEKLGIWALVLAISSMVQVANLGMSGSIVKNVADCDASGDKKNMAVVIQTAVISIGLFTAILILGAYPFVKAYLGYMIEPKLYRDAEEILPIAMLAFLVTMVGGIYQGALYGCQLILQRNVLLMIDSVSYLLLCVITLPGYGLSGLAYARLGQTCLTLVFTVILLRRHVPQLPKFPLHWSKSHFKEMLGYAANFQIISLLVMLSDPITKGYLSKYGNISMVGYYEMANRIVHIFRSMLINANQVLVPTFAFLEKLDSKKISDTYIASYKIMYYLSLPGFCLLAISAPLISELLIGREESFFIWATVILCGGWLINTLAVPAYFATIGTGSMKPNIVAHVAMTIVNLILIYILGQLLGGDGVLLAWVCSLVTGGIILNMMYYRAYRIAWHNLIPEASRVLTILCLLCLIVVYGIWRYSPAIESSIMNSMSLSYKWTKVMTSSVMIITFIAVVCGPMWNHPVRRKLWGLVTDGRSTTNT